MSQHVGVHACLPGRAIITCIFCGACPERKMASFGRSRLLNLRILEGYRKALEYDVLVRMMPIMSNSYHNVTCYTTDKRSKKEHVSPMCHGNDTFTCNFINKRQVSRVTTQYMEPGIIKRIFRKFGKLDYSHNNLKHGGYLLYEKCADEISFEEFRNFCNLPDTFFSWFLITEFHVWMCMVRAMHEGSEGRCVRNAIVSTLWQDASARMKKLGDIPLSKRKEQLDELYEQFIAALFLYDEGLQSNDKVLAGAIWRRLLQSECDIAEIVESLVHYVRKQALHLESLSREDILINGKITWLPLTPSKHFVF